MWSEADSIDFRARSATIREWLKECQTSHPKCQRFLKSDLQLAARILSIQEKEVNRYSVKLVPTQDIDLNKEPYAVLSHVWGDIELPCKTTRSNITQYYDTGIDFDCLPKTFQDAIRLTAVIGFQYLWIDSLCIIQDDTEDWHRESAKMAAIYGTGTITISATSAKNSHGGCGLSPKPQSVKRFCNVGSGRPELAARETVDMGTNPTGVLQSELKDGPFHSRAWILQEKMLSRRVLHALYSQFVWQCNTITESEDSMIFSQETDLPLHREQSGDNFELDDYEFDRHWWKCVEDYSKRTLGRPSDQYAALAGIVRFHQEMSGDRPIVGLWEHHLPIHLGWEVFRDDRDHKSTPLVEPASRRPSWTWMSFRHGSVTIWGMKTWQYFRKNESIPGDQGIVYQAQVLNTDIQWSGEPFTSDPSGCSISIRGIMRRMRRPKPLRHGIRSPLRLDPGLDDQSGGSGEYDTLALFAYGLSAGLKNQLPVVTTVYLIVRATEGEEKSTYMRIGSMKLTEDFDMGRGLAYIPEGVQRDITLI